MPRLHSRETHPTEWLGSFSFSFSLIKALFVSLPSLMAYGLWLVAYCTPYKTDKCSGRQNTNNHLFSATMAHPAAACAENAAVAELRHEVQGSRRQDKTRQRKDNRDKRNEARTGNSFNFVAHWHGMELIHHIHHPRGTSVLCVAPFMKHRQRSPLYFTTSSESCSESPRAAG